MNPSGSPGREMSNASTYVTRSGYWNAPISTRTASEVFLCAAQSEEEFVSVHFEGLTRENAQKLGEALLAITVLREKP